MTEAFASGEVSWLLNTAGKNIGEDGHVHSGVWSQGTSCPVFAAETNKAVYKVGIAGAVTVTADVAHVFDAAITSVTPTVTGSIKFAYNVMVANTLTPAPTLEIEFGSKTVTLTAVANDVGGYINWYISRMQSTPCGI